MLFTSVHLYTFLYVYVYYCSTLLQMNLAGNSPFPLGLSRLKQNGGAKLERNIKNKNSTLRPLGSYLPSCTLTTLTNSMQGLACWATSEAIKEGYTVLLTKTWCSDTSQCRQWLLSAQLCYCSLTASLLLGYCSVAAPLQVCYYFVIPLCYCSVTALLCCM